MMFNTKEASSAAGDGGSSRKKKSWTARILNKVHNSLFKYKSNLCCSYDPDSHEHSAKEGNGGINCSFAPKSCLKKRNAAATALRSTTPPLNQTGDDMSPSFSWSFTGKRDTGDWNSLNGLSRGASRKIMFSNSNGTVSAPSMEKNLKCTLEELCFGCNKNIKVHRDVVHTKSGQLVQEEEILKVEVKPGWRQGTKTTFVGEKREPPGTFTAEVTLEITEEEHPLFRRNGDDLEMKVEIPLVKALTGSCTVPVTLLGGDTMQLEIEDIIHPGFEKKISGQGMPVSEHEQQSCRGDLRVLFLVNFPTQLTDEQREDVVRILQECC